MKAAASTLHNYLNKRTFLFHHDICAHATTDRQSQLNMADDVKLTIILAQKTSASRRNNKLVGDRPRKKDKPIDTGKLRTCAK